MELLSLTPQSAEGAGNPKEGEIRRVSHNIPIAHPKQHKGDVWIRCPISIRINK